MTRGEGGGDNEGKKGKGHQGTCIKDPWTKPKRGRIEGGRWTGGSGGRKMETTACEQQYKKFKKGNKSQKKTHEVKQNICKSCI